MNIFPSKEAVKMWPVQVKDYLLKIIQFEMPIASASVSVSASASLQNILPNAKDAVGKPKSILAVTMNTGIKYLCQFKNGAQKLMANTDTQLIVSFLESRIEIDGRNQTQKEVPGTKS